MQKTNERNVNADIEALFKAGAHYGYSKTRRHPSTSPYIYTTKNKGDIINLEETTLMLAKALEFIASMGEAGKTVLLVGTKPEAKDVVRDMSLSLGMPYTTERWIGGTISNWSEIKKKITELEEYRKGEATETKKYTKKERLVLAKRMEKLAKYYGGLMNLKKLPDALFVIDKKKEHIAVQEAGQRSIPVVALANSDSEISDIEYPILANDAAIPSIKFFAEKIVEAYKNGLARAVSLRAEEDLKQPPRLE